MSFTTEPTAKTDPTSNRQGNGFTPHGPSLKAGGPRALPSKGKASRIVPLAILGVLLIAAAIPAGWYFFLKSAPVRADVLLHTVKREPLIVTVTEKGTIESADNSD